MDWISQNISWLLILVIVPIIVAIIKKTGANKNEPSKLARIENTNNNNNPTNNNNNLTVNNIINGKDNNSTNNHDNCETQKLESHKLSKHILFIDDDTKFKVVTILKKSGWIHTKSVKDIDSYDSKEVIETDIFFVDIQGVGILLSCKDGGLGLAMNLKNKYPQKKVVIYSAETKGERFHEALRIADSFLPKDAEPYQFQQLVEELCNN